MTGSVRACVKLRSRATVQVPRMATRHLDAVFANELLPVCIATGGQSTLLEAWLRNNTAWLLQQSMIMKSTLDHTGNTTASVKKTTSHYQSNIHVLHLIVYYYIRFTMHDNTDDEGDGGALSRSVACRALCNILPNPNVPRRLLQEVRRTRAVPGGRLCVCAHAGGRRACPATWLLFSIMCSSHKFPW